MRVRCELCPKSCNIESGQRGDCKIRINRDGRLSAVTYGYPCAVNKDPIEKKPLFHMFPGTQILSLATAGCNLHCKNCQNWQISQANPEDIPAYHLPPENLVKVMLEAKCSSVAYTYTEPLAYYEYTLDSCRQVHEAEYHNVLVTAGYINKEPLRKLLPYVHAANIDLKAYSDTFYRNICAGTLKPVLDTLVLAKEYSVLVEITNLVIPTLNDTDKDFEQLCKWITFNMGKETPLHFSRFYPQYRLRNLPPTPLSTLERAREIALDNGLYYVYIGNIIAEDAENTKCHVCGKLLIRRKGYSILENNIINGSCPQCKSEVYGIWK